MANLSRNGIAYNLLESPYEYAEEYEENNDYNIIAYIFSSELYKNKFKNEQLKHRKKINESLSNRFGVKIIVPMLSDIHLYSKIEKRGFLIRVNGVNIECLDNITLDGMNPILKI